MGQVSPLQLPVSDVWGRGRPGGRSVQGLAAWAANQLAHGHFNTSYNYRAHQVAGSLSSSRTRCVTGPSHCSPVTKAHLSLPCQQHLGLPVLQRWSPRIRGTATSSNTVEPREPADALQPGPRLAPPTPGWPGWPLAGGQGPSCQGGTDRAIVGLRLGSADGPVQAGAADVDVKGLGQGSQQRQQRLRVDIVVVIHVAEPPVGTEGRRSLEGLPKGCQQLRPHSPSVNSYGWGGSRLR